MSFFTFIIFVTFTVVNVYCQDWRHNMLAQMKPIGIRSGWTQLPERKKLVIFDIHQTILDAIECERDFDHPKIKDGIIHKIKMYPIDTDYICVVFRPGFMEYLTDKISRRADYMLYTRESFTYGIRIAEYIERWVNNAAPALGVFKFKMVLSTQEYGMHKKEAEKVKKRLDPILYDLLQLSIALDIPGHSSHYFYHYFKIYVVDDKPDEWSSFNEYPVSDFISAGGSTLMINVKRFDVWPKTNPGLDVLPILTNKDIVTVDAVFTKYDNIKDTYKDLFDLELPKRTRERVGPY